MKDLPKNSSETPVPDIRTNNTGRCSKNIIHDPHWWGVNFWCDGKLGVKDDEIQQ